MMRRQQRRSRAHRHHQARHSRCRATGPPWRTAHPEKGEDGGWVDYQDIIEDDFYELIGPLGSEIARLKLVIKNLKDGK